MFPEHDAEHGGGGREVVRDAGHAPARRGAGEVRDREAGEPGVSGGIPRGLRQRAPPDPRQDERVEREQQMRGEIDRLRAGAQLEADGGEDAQATERDQRGESLGRAQRLRPQPGDPLRGGEQEGCEREPGPALPEHHADRRGAGDEQERLGGGAQLGADQHGRRHGAEDAQAGDALGLPADGEDRGGRGDPEREREPGRGGDQLIGLDGHDDAGEQPGDPGRRGRERAVGAAAALVSARTERHEGERGGRREQRARLLADPVARDGDHEEEEQPREQRQPARPGEDAAAEQVLEGRRGRPTLRGRRELEARIRGGSDGGGDGWRRDARLPRRRSNAHGDLRMQKGVRPQPDRGRRHSPGLELCQPGLEEPRPLLQPVHPLVDRHPRTSVLVVDHRSANTDPGNR